MTDNTLPSTKLFFTEGSSDKIYQAQIKKRGELYAVEFQFGRRDGALKAGTKTETPVDLDTALKIYDKLVKEKTGKGYTPDSSGAAYQDTVHAERITGLQPALPSPLEAESLEQYLRDPNWVMQQKFDGERRMLIKDEGTGAHLRVQGANKKGLRVALPMNIVNAMQAFENPLIALDGELIGERLYVFDLLWLSDPSHKQVLGQSYQDRIALGDRIKSLEELFARYKTFHANNPEALNAIQLVHTAHTEHDKRKLFEDIQEKNLEGVVFKHRNGTGDQLKYKFVESATVLVLAHSTGKRSVAIAALDDAGQQVPIGNVTIPASHAIPGVGSIVEVRYLYAHAGGSLVQPVYLGRRPDQDRNDCLLSKIKLKGAQPEESAQPDTEPEFDPEYQDPPTRTERARHRA